MKKRFLFAWILLVAQQIVMAQNTKHQIVFQLVTSDTLAHKAFMKQLNNIYTVSPESIVKVVVHGPGIDMYNANKSVVGPQLQLAVKRGVVFEVCEFSLKERKIEKSTLFTHAQFTPAGIIRIVELQEAGFSYVKAGF
jgi:intracellular sulfur oxidation DsrE/DsrF family protein